MADDKTNTQEPQGAASQPGRTFTQAEVDAIVGDRLARERAKFADYEQLKDKAAKFDQVEEASKSDLQKEQDKSAKLQAELDKMKAQASAQAARDKVAAAKGVPAHLLTGSTEEECTAQADKLLQWRGDAQKYPGVKDGGEVTPQTGGKTRDKFAEWYNTLNNSK